MKINLDELERLKKGHLADTRRIVALMYSHLPKDLKSKVNLVNLQQAAMLHDYGKILIPDKILNKKGDLTPNERRIVEFHSELGYELLKSMNVNKEVLELIKYHHQTPSGKGYPEIKKDFEYSIESQMLRAADEYSALTEQRSYKPALTRNVALSMIFSDKNISGEVCEALEKAV